MAWCGNDHLILIVAKTKEMVVDVRRTGTMLNTISILGEEIEVAEKYRYLGLIHLDNRLDGKCGIEAVHRKEQSSPLTPSPLLCAARC